MNKIKIAIIGVGDRTSSLIQGIHYYQDKKFEDLNGIKHWDIGGYWPGDIEIVAAFDIDGRKVGKDVNEAVRCMSYCSNVFNDFLTDAGISVQMGRILDGYSPHVTDYSNKRIFYIADYAEPGREEVVNIFKTTGSEVIINNLPPGADNASKFYAYCALDAGVSFVNNTSVFLASNPLWALKFEYKDIPIIGDDLSSQFSVEDSAGSAGAAIDSIRCAKLAVNRGLNGTLFAPSAYFCKNPMRQFAENDAFDMIDRFINEGRCSCAYRTHDHTRQKKQPVLSER